MSKAKAIDEIGKCFPYTIAEDSPPIESQPSLLASDVDIEGFYQQGKIDMARELFESLCPDYDITVSFKK